MALGPRGGCFPLRSRHGRLPTSIACTCPEPLSASSTVLPPRSSPNSRGTSPGLMTPSRAWPWASAAGTLITARLAVAPGWLCTLELAIRIRLLLFTMIIPIGAAPTLTRAMSACAGSVRSLTAEKPSNVSLSLLVAQTSLPAAEVIKQTGLQPAVAVDTIDDEGLTSARCRSRTVIVPSDGLTVLVRDMLVTYQDRQPI